MSIETVTKATHPPPPPFYRLYTEASKAPDHPDHSLWTPPEPIKGSFTKFAINQTDSLLVHELLPPIVKFYDIPPEGELKINFSGNLRKLNRLLAERYVALLDALLSQPDKVEELVTTLAHLFFNITHLLKLMRAHQARQGIIAVMEKQIINKKTKTQELKQQIEEAKLLLEQHGLRYGDDTSLSPLPPPPTSALEQLKAELDSIADEEAPLPPLAASDRSIDDTKMQPS